MSQFLLDTHVLVWSQQAPEKLGKKTQKLLLDPGHALIVSAISALEIARLESLGQLRFTRQSAAWFGDALSALGASMIDVSAPVCFEAYALAEPFHKDPADRIIVATARLFDATLITADERLLEFPFVRGLDATR